MSSVKQQAVEIAERIRRAIYGSEVREYIAKGAELCGDTIDEAKREADRAADAADAAKQTKTELISEMENNIYHYVSAKFSGRIKFSYIGGQRSPASAPKTKIYVIPRDCRAIRLGMTSQAFYDIYGFLGDSQTTAISYVQEDGTPERYDINITTIPPGAKLLYIVSTTENIDTATVEFLVPKTPSNVPGSYVVWFGTSIPAGGKIGKDNENSYPMKIGKKLGMRVINESIGTSCVTCKDPSLISAFNPYGFTNNFERASRCLTNSVNEMNWIIDHFNDTRVFSYLTVSSLSDDDREFIRSCSYENKLYAYLGDEANVHLFVFDHGHNDEITEEKEALYTKEAELSGTNQNGRYQGDEYITRPDPCSIKFDVSAYDFCYITGRIYNYCNTYTLLDGNNNIISYKQSGQSGENATNLKVYLNEAKYIVVSTSNDVLGGVTVRGAMDGDSNLYCYRGAMGFLFKKILTYRPHAKIALIGEYENENQPLVAKYQQIVANDWNIPIYKQWEHYGWSQKLINTQYNWVDGYLVKGDAFRKSTVLDLWLADHVHPHSDKSGEATEYIANHISAWINGLAL